MLRNFESSSIKSDFAIHFLILIKTISAKLFINRLTFGFIISIFNGSMSFVISKCNKKINNEERTIR